jgi:transposase, IS5 family
MFKAIKTVATLRQSGYEDESCLLEIESFIDHAERQIEQTYRWVTLEEKIPHDEKEGKAGVPQELTLKVCVVEDQYGFILNHQVMQHQTDDQVAIPIIPKPKKCSLTCQDAALTRDFTVCLISLD